MVCTVLDWEVYASHLGAGLERDIPHLQEELCSLVVQWVHMKAAEVEWGRKTVQEGRKAGKVVVLWVGVGWLSVSLLSRRRRCMERWVGWLLGSHTLRWRVLGG